MSLLRKLLIVLITVLTILHAAKTEAKSPFGKAYLEQITEALKLVFVADEQLFQNMQYISARLQRYYIRNGHLPEPGAQQDTFRTMLSKHISFNPYKPEITDLYTNEKLPGPINIYFLSDGGINRDSIKQWRKTPPPSWQGEPGSIFILTNGNGLFAIWAASADRLPIRKLQSDGTTRIIYHDMASPENRPQVSSSWAAN